MADDDSERPDDTTAMSERLDELERKIEEVRQRAQDDDLIDDPDEPHYYESGSEHPEEDDQEIAPG